MQVLNAILIKTEVMMLKIKVKHDNLKSKYKIWYTLIRQSGFDIDKNTEYVTTSDKI